MLRFMTIAIVLAAAPSPALAWGKTGHRTIGELAERRLTPEAEAAVRAILGVETLAEASTWPDFMRSDPSEFWQRTANPWHYVTVPRGQSYDEVGPPVEGDAVTALDRFSRTVRDESAPLEDRKLALRFIVHIVGDLHQPLHAGHGGDQGGNAVRVTFMGRPTNLHAVWDSGLVDDLQLSFTELTAWLAARTSNGEARTWSTADPRTWIAESTVIRDRIYPPAGQDDLGYDYIHRNQPVAVERLRMGGVRLATYLNGLFAAR